jgi:hypothetical protein
MSANLLAALFDDMTLTQIAAGSRPDPAMWSQRYDPFCPSEFYRGYATLLARIGDAFRRAPYLEAMRSQVEFFDVAVRTLPEGERRNGASFALANVGGYTQVGTPPQIVATLEVELVCIANCFLENKGKGL